MHILFTSRKQKKSSFDSSFIKKFAPHRFDKFSFVHGEGASSGLLII
jgi:hypothetical protein